MATKVRTGCDAQALVEHLFEQVLTDPERAELLIWIHRWEAANPDADPAHRVTGWIDVAYAFQARPDRRPHTEASAVTSARWPDGVAARFA
ncbi:MAG TPA: hypothetical protein VES02_00150 [Dermatophilaceae bacterium]|nr:hypothetical protein [Dermatophilaceae bacterium]